MLRSQLALLPLIVILAYGCTDPGPQAKFQEYLQRLSRGLDTERIHLPVNTTTNQPLLPRPGALHWDLERSKLNTLDFLSLSGCELQITIGKRNSSLGRAASASQRLLLDLEYLRLAPPCAEWLRDQGDVALADELSDAYDLKRLQLPRRVFNATLGEGEYRSLWQRPHSLGSYPLATSSAVSTALTALSAHIRRWLGGDYRADNREFEILLSEVAKGDGGALLASLSMQAAVLEEANTLIQRRISQRPLCPRGSPLPEADILKNVVRKFFIGGIQPWSADLERRYYDLLPPIDDLEQQLAGHMPDAYLAWMDQRNRQLIDSRHAPRQHVEAVQGALEGCSDPNLKRNG